MVDETVLKCYDPHYKKLGFLCELFLLCIFFRGDGSAIKQHQNLIIQVALTVRFFFYLFINS